MTSSLLQGKNFYCREWAFSKIHHCLDNRPTSKTCGALIMGGPGCGKTAMCCEYVWPTSLTGRQVTLSKKLLAYYFCQAHDIDTLAIGNFIQCLIEQISHSKLIEGYSEKLQDPMVQALLKPSECERNPDAAFKKGVLEPLNAIKQPSQNLSIVVDSIDESYMQAISDRTTGSRTIAELLANHHIMFPKWLLLVCSARKQSKSVTRMFTGFRKISLDDLRKSHVVRDVQQYILCRLDQEEELRQHLSRETAEMLNQLHIKSNGCFLYLEKVLDGVADSFIMLREIKEIPGTLNGLYLWLCQRIFIRKQFANIQPILNVILAARGPLTETELYTCVYTRNTELTYDNFERNLAYLSKVLIDGKDGTKILFHHSFAEWLLDVKHCTQKYLCNAAEGHAMLALSFTLHAESLNPPEVQDFALHLYKSNLQPPLQFHDLVLWLIQSGVNVEDALKDGLPKEQTIVKLLHEAGASIPTPEASAAKDICFPLAMTERCEPDEQLSVDALDTSGRTLLSSAAYDGDLDIVVTLIEKGADLEIEDKHGQTALNMAARQGHHEVVQALVNASCFVDHTDGDGWTPLRSAAWGGHTQVVAILLEANAEVDHADTDQRTALRASAWGGHEEIVRNLVEHGADVNKTDHEGRTALIAAAYMCHVEIVEYLLDHGADINQADIDGRTALSVASLCLPASDGHDGVVSLLLDRGAEVDHCDKDGMTPLLVAAFEGHNEVCELLLEADADVDHTDKSGRTPLQAAASMGHSIVVNLLLFWGTAIDTIDSEGRTVLCIACQHGNIDVVRQLLERGLDEMHRDNNGWTPMHIAAYEGHSEVVDLLIESGAKVGEVDNEGRIPLNLATQEGHVSTVASLVEAGSPLEARALDGKTPLRGAAMEGHCDVVRYLVAQGADIDYKDADGRSTLYMLALENQITMAAIFLENGVKVESRDIEGRTALHVAAWQGHYQMCELLLNNAASVDAMDSEKRTPLQSAAWQGHHTIVRLLLERKAKVDHTCTQGATALCIASQEGHEDVVRVLLQFNANPNHVDQYGRSAARVAMKGSHSRVVKLLEEFGAHTTNQRRSGGSSGSAGSDTRPPLAHPVYANISIPSNSNHHTRNHIYSNLMSMSYSDSPASTVDNARGSQNVSGMTKSSSNLSHSNTSSTNQSGCSVPAPESPGVMSLSFTQQLQQASANKNKKNRVLSPVNEPQNHSASGSPLSEVYSPHATPERLSPVQDKRHSVPQQQNHSSKQAASKSKHRKSDSHHAKKSSKASSRQSGEEPVWQRQSGTASGIPRDPYGSVTVMGQKALSMKSPDQRKKRNHIATNPNFSKPGGTPVSINGYFNKLSNLPDTLDDYAPEPPVRNGASSSHRDGKHEGRRRERSSKQRPAQRPNGLPLKKETPL